MQLIKDYVRENSSLLFHHAPNNELTALFDTKGFSFTLAAQNNYNIIKNNPHLYVAWTNDENGYYYVGKSFQSGGRWKRSHAYHLGTLAHHLHNTIRYDDQNHAHWIEHWMNEETQSQIENNLFSIGLKKEVYISFIPFSVYSNQDILTLPMSEIRQINTNIESQLIESYIADGIQLLNVQNNRRTRLKIIQKGPWTLDAADDFINKNIHLVCIAVNALTTYGCYSKAVGGLTNEEAETYVQNANQKNKSISLYPKLNLTILPLSIDDNSNDFNERDILFENIKRSIDINEEIVKSSKMIFAIERGFDFNIDLALEILKELDISYNFKVTKRILFYNN